MNSDSELSFDTRAVVNLASELVTSGLVGLLFGLFGLGLTFLMFTHEFDDSVVIRWLTGTYEGWRQFYLSVLLIPIAVAIISLAILRPVIDRVQGRKSWFTITLLSQGISIPIFLLFWLWHYSFGTSEQLLDAIQFMLSYETPLNLIMFWIIFVAFAEIGILLLPQNRLMKIVALATSASVFAMLYEIAVLHLQILSLLANFAAP